MQPKQSQKDKKIDLELQEMKNPKITLNFLDESGCLNLDAYIAFIYALREMVKDRNQKNSTIYQLSGVNCKEKYNKENPYYSIITVKLNHYTLYAQRILVNNPLQGFSYDRIIGPDDQLQYGHYFLFNYENATGILVSEQLRFGIIDCLGVRQKLNQVKLESQSSSFGAGYLYNYLLSGKITNELVKNEKPQYDFIYKSWQDSTELNMKHGASQAAALTQEGKQMLRREARLILQTNSSLRTLMTIGLQQSIKLPNPLFERQQPQNYTPEQIQSMKQRLQSNIGITYSHLKKTVEKILFQNEIVVLVHRHIPKKLK